ILGAQGARAARAHPAHAREADVARPRPRVRSLRSQPRCAGVAAAQADRSRSPAAAADPDRLGRRLRLRTGRRMTRAARVPATGTATARGARPISLFWRTFGLVALLIVASFVATLAAARLLERAPPEQRLAWEIASVVNLTRSALVSAEPERRLQLLDELAQQEEVRVLPKEPGDVVDPSATRSEERRVGKECV